MKTPDELADRYYDTCEFIGRVPDVIKQAFLSGYAAANRWISVEEELPEREGEYLVYSQFGRTECCTKLLLSRLRVAFFSMNDESRIVTTEGFLYPDGCIDFNISHSMPLPPLPNE